MDLASKAARPLVIRCAMLTAAVLITLCAPTTSSAMDRDAIEHMTGVGKHMLSLVVRVHARTGDGRTNLGSGVPIAPNLVATNCHVTRSASAVDVMANTFEGPGVFAAVAQAAFSVRDLCVLRLAHAMSMPPIRLAPSREIGDPLVAVGFTGGMAPKVHVGKLVALHPYETAQIIETTTAFDQGAFGGGVFSASGALVGLVTFRSQERQPRYFVTPVQWIRELLDLRDFRPIAPQSQRPYWDEPEERLPDFLKRSP